jgi:hypothetical protein
LEPNVEGMLEEEDEGLEEKEKKKVVKAMHCLDRCTLFIFILHYWSMHCLDRCALLVYAYMRIIDSLKRKDTTIKKIVRLVRLV